MLAVWNVQYARWIIDDGEPEREVGENFPWPVLGFHSMEGMSSTTTRTQSVLEVDDYGYDVGAEVLHVSPTATVISFGLIAFGEPDSVPRGCKVGDYVVGRIRLSFLHYCDPSIPGKIRELMFHNWSVKRILADVVPHRFVDQSADRLIGGSKEAGYVQVKTTREKKVKSYILSCCIEK